jgi:hypothetical protein
MPPIEVVTPKGVGECLFLLDYGPDVNTVWLVHLFGTREVLHFQSSEIRLVPNPMNEEQEKLAVSRAVTPYEWTRTS